jgi:hypothetical protein
MNETSVAHNYEILKRLERLESKMIFIAENLEAYNKSFRESKEDPRKLGFDRLLHYFDRISERIKKV